MVFRFHERPNSRAQSKDSHTLLYVAAGSSDDAYVRGFAKGAIPKFLATDDGVLYRQDVKLEPNGRDIFYVSADFAPQKNDVGSYTWGFNTTGGTVRVKTSRSTVQRYPPNAFDHKQLIGVHGKDVDGAEIVIQAMKFDVEYSHPLGVVTMDHAQKLHDLTGTVNSTRFFRWAAGEVLFLGAIGSDGSEAPAKVSYQFVMSKNANGITIGDINGIAKEGHDYLWITYEPDVVADKPGMKPSAVYIERLYERVDLAGQLGFGG